MASKKPAEATSKSSPTGIWSNLVQLQKSGPVKNEVAVTLIIINKQMIADNLTVVHCY